jgi:hypothetical protein
MMVSNRTALAVFAFVVSCFMTAMDSGFLLPAVSAGLCSYWSVQADRAKRESRE